MIINTGNRTDIPAYYADWFYNRINEKYVLVRNPYNQKLVTKYMLTPKVVDVICFCTKNPKPMLSRLDEISMFKQFWFVTITPYDKNIEPNVPPNDNVINSFKELSNKVGVNAVSFRYDPIFINETYTLDFHIKSFEKICKSVHGYAEQCVISFIDLYEKTKRNFKGIREVKKDEQEFLISVFVEIGNRYNIKIFTCCENVQFEKFGVDISGCMTKKIIEKAIGEKLDIPKSIKNSRESCDCLLNNDIGEYNTCGHKCLYCYANYDKKTVDENMKKHNSNSPILIGQLNKDDIVKIANQESYLDYQLKLF